MNYLQYRQTYIRFCCLNFNHSFTLMADFFSKMKCVSVHTWPPDKVINSLSVLLSIKGTNLYFLTGKSVTWAPTMRISIISRCNSLLYHPSRNRMQILIKFLGILIIFRTKSANKVGRVNTDATNLYKKYLSALCT